MENRHNQLTHPDTYLDLINEIYNSLYKTFGKNFWTQISTRWRLTEESKKTSSPHNSSAIYDPTKKECLVLMTPMYVSRFQYNPSLEESFLTFIHQLRNFANRFPTQDNKDILIYL